MQCSAVQCSDIATTQPPLARTTDRTMGRQDRCRVSSDNLAAELELEQGFKFQILSSTCASASDRQGCRARAVSSQ